MSLGCGGWQWPYSKARQTVFLWFSPKHNSLGVWRRSMIQVPGNYSCFFVSQSLCPKASYWVGTHCPCVQVPRSKWAFLVSDVAQKFFATSYFLMLQQLDLHYNSLYSKNGALCEILRVVHRDWDGATYFTKVIANSCTNCVRANMCNRSVK